MSYMITDLCFNLCYIFKLYVKRTYRFLKKAIILICIYRCVVVFTFVLGMKISGKQFVWSTCFLGLDITEMYIFDIFKCDFFEGVGVELKTNSDVMLLVSI